MKSKRERESKDVSPCSPLPKHVAIIMDGNGRWAEQRHLPRVAGHRAGVDAVRQVISTAIEQGIEVLTLFAFSSENWQRPQQEVSFLMGLFQSLLEKEIKKLHDNHIQFKVIGERLSLNPILLKTIQMAEQQTAINTGLKLRLAVNYGGRWDIVNATKVIAQQVAAGKLAVSDISADLIAENLSMKEDMDPDLFIRTSGELRISNFLLWQMAYSELAFVPEYWPDFNKSVFLRTLQEFALRQRRFGLTGEQLYSA